MENLVKGNKKSLLSKSLIRAAQTNDNRLHVLPLKGKWGVKLEGAKRMYRVDISKSSALKLAKEKAIRLGNSMIIIHNKDGRISSIASV